MMHLLLRPLAGAFLFLALASATLASAAGHFVRAEDIDVTALIPPAPADDSLTTAADLEVVYQLQQRRTPEQLALGSLYVADSIFNFQPIIGSWFNAANLPFTDQFFRQVQADRFAITSRGKLVWKRPRPPLLDPRIQPAIELPSSGAYPSGHATQSFLWIGLLAEVFPEHREALRRRAELVAWSRVVGGVHYPSDIVAGRMLGDRLVGEFLRVPAVREALERVKAEVGVASRPPARKD